MTSTQPSTVERQFPIPVRAVMIDLDGTMLDTVADLAAAVNLTLEKLGRAPLDEALVRTFVGKGIPHLVRRTLEAWDRRAVDDADFDAALTTYLACYEQTNGRNTVVYPGVVDGLNAMREAGFPLACVTNKSERFTLPLLEQMQMRQYFSVIVAGDTLARKKPDPLPLTYACEKLGVAASEMLMIGDSVNDAVAARAAGCPVFCVPYGYNEGRDVRELDVDAIVTSLLEAVQLIIKS